jgi:hypothetical protein
MQAASLALSGIKFIARLSTMGKKDFYPAGIS